MNVEKRGRMCPECKTVMTLILRGHFTSLYLCPGCGSTLTLPPPEPAVPPKGLSS